MLGTNAAFFQAISNKDIDVKGAAELLGVSYGTLYGRYREVFGYLKHGWNSAPSFHAAAAATSTASTLQATKAAAANQSASNPIPRLELGAALEAGTVGITQSLGRSKIKACC